MTAADEARVLQPEQTHSAEYNRGWADGQASALDACQPVINGLQARLAATPPADGLRKAAERVIEWYDDPEPHTRPVAMQSLKAATADIRAALAARSEPRAEGLPQHSAECAAQDEDADCICGVSDAYALGLCDGAATPPAEGPSRAQLEWFAWFVRKSKGTVAEVTARALEQNPYLRAPEQPE